MEPERSGVGTLRREGGAILQPFYPSERDPNIAVGHEWRRGEAVSARLWRHAPAGLAPCLADAELWCRAMTNFVIVFEDKVNPLRTLGGYVPNGCFCVLEVAK